MKIQEDLNDGVLKLSFVGSLDETSAQSVEDKVNELLESDAQNILFDLSGVQYISSIGIRVFILAHKKAIKMGKKLMMGDISEKARDILDTVGILPIFAKPENI